MRRSSGDYLAELLRNQHLSPAELARLQSRRAASIARFAADSTQYYRRLFDEHGVDVERLEDHRGVGAHPDHRTCAGEGA